MPSVGVLALQGGVREHVSILEILGCGVREVRTPADLEDISALFLPGGESTTLISLMNRWGLTRKLRQMGGKGFPIFGTCAGAILLCRVILEKEHDISQDSLALADVKAVRNYFGRQTSSFIQPIRIRGLSRPFKGVFIRAPLLEPLSKRVEVLSRVEDGPVLLRQDNLWMSSFHPELTADVRVHRLFLKEHGILEGADDADL
ncbi:MAG: pyridoxal 5'-phosphate synthase glutaminase subunit PdxT [Candidatus Aegiribacteria sp.]